MFEQPQKERQVLLPHALLVKRQDERPALRLQEGATAHEATAVATDEAGAAAVPGFHQIEALMVPGILRGAEVERLVLQVIQEFCDGAGREPGLRQRLQGLPRGHEEHSGALVGPAKAAGAGLEVQLMHAVGTDAFR
jgi:hypothetical protein